MLNGAILTLSKILKCVAAPSAEVKLSTLFLNAIEVKNIRIALEELGHPQPPIPIHCNNTTSVGIVNSLIKRQRSWDMNTRYFFLLCQQS